jgi:O-antigen ligase
MTAAYIAWTRRADRKVLLAIALGTPLVSGVAVLTPQQPGVALGLAAVALVAALLVRGTPTLIVAAVPAVWLSEIVRLAGGALSIADAVLIVAAVAAVMRLDLSNRHLRSALLFVAGFQALQLLALAHAFAPYAAQEWAHRLLLLAGGLMIGAALVTTGRLAVATRLFIAGGLVIAVLSVIFAAATRFAPAYPLLNKNYAGDLLATACLIVLFAPRDLTRLGRLRVPIVVVLALGLAATQSRGAVVGLGCGLIVYALFRRRFDGLSVLVVLAAVSGVIVVAVMLGGEAQIEQQQQYGALFYRQQDLQQALAVWQSSPLLGSGIRFWQSGTYALQGDPHNVLVLTLAESGAIGLLAFAALLGGVITLVIRRRSDLAVLALALLTARLVHGLFDVYWVHGSLAIPWILAGAALARPRKLI